MVKFLTACMATVLAFSANAAQEERSEIRQDAYLLGEVSHNEIEDYDGYRVGGLFGVRNVYPNDFFVGGEIEFAFYDNTLGASGTIEAQYSGNAYVPVGKQIVLSGNKNLNLFGLVGYSAVRLESTTTTASETVDGFAWGLGGEMNFDDWIVGLRYVYGGLDDLDETNISLSIGKNLNF